MINIVQGNCIDKIQELDDNSIDCVVSSPPYFGLRDYGTAQWQGGDPNCDHLGKPQATRSNIHDRTQPQCNNKKDETVREIFKNICKKCGAKRIDEQFGLEKTYQDYLANTVKVFETFKPKLKDTATIWWNVGDSYNTKPAGNKDLKKSSGLPNKKENLHKRKDNISKVLLKSLKEKDLLMIPNRVAIALQDAGWYIRSEIIWHKPNPMPESIKDRPTSCHEKIWLITKNKKYYYDADAIREPLASSSLTRLNQDIKNQKGSARGNGGRKTNGNMKAVGNLEKRNKRNVWTITTKPFKEAHFATFPPDLIEPCIKAGCPEKVCVECGFPYISNYKRTDNNKNFIQTKGKDTPNIKKGGVRLNENGTTPHFNPPTIEFLNLKKNCNCKTDKFKSGVVLDPFAGAGTTGIVARSLNRTAILIELNPEYIEISKNRIDKEFGMFK